MSTPCQTCGDLRASWSILDNGEVPPRCPEHRASSGAPAVGRDRICREATAFRAMAKYGITVGSWDGKRFRASSRLMHGATPDEYPSELEAVEAMAAACERASQAMSPWPTAEGLEIANPDASITLIDVQARSGDFIATVRGGKGLWDCGSSEHEAAGRLLITHYDHFRIAVKWPNGSTTSNHPEAEASCR